MIRLVENKLEGQFAAPLNHPVTSGNPAPWRIDEMRIEFAWDRDLEKPIWKVWIRNLDSMWFRADQCYVARERELLDYLNLSEADLKEREEIFKKGNEKRAKDRFYTKVY